MKPTVGSVGMDGIFVVSKFFDVAGEMTKSVIDLAHLTEHIFDTDAREKLPKDGYMSVLNTEWTGLRIGFLQPDDWILPPALVEPDETVHAEIRLAILNTKNMISALGADVTFPVELPNPLKTGMYPMMSEVIMEALIAYNKSFARLDLRNEYPEQSLLEDSVKHSVTAAKYEESKTKLRKLGLDGVKKALNDHNLDAIIGPTDSPLASIAACAGKLPASQLKGLILMVV